MRNIASIRKNTDQFAFAGVTIDILNRFLGFLVPQSGFIKKVNVKIASADFIPIVIDRKLFTITINGHDAIRCFMDETDTRGMIGYKKILFDPSPGC